MKYLILVLLLLFGIMTQTYFIAIPVVVGEIVIITVLFPKWWIFLLTIATGIVLDSISFYYLGASSLFFTVVVGSLFLYSRKYEMQNPFFVGMSIFLSSLLYGALFIHKYSFWGALVNSFSLTLIYIGILYFLIPKKKDLLKF